MWNLKTLNFEFLWLNGRQQINYFFWRPRASADQLLFLASTGVYPICVGLVTSSWTLFQRLLITDSCLYRHLFPQNWFFYKTHESFRRSNFQTSFDYFVCLFLSSSFHNLFVMLTFVKMSLKKNFALCFSSYYMQRLSCTFSLLFKMFVLRIPSWPPYTEKAYLTFPYTENAYHTIPYIKCMEKCWSYSFHPLSKNHWKKIRTTFCGYLNQLN